MNTAHAHRHQQLMHRHIANKGLTMSKDMKALEEKSQTPADIKIWCWQLSEAANTCKAHAWSSLYHPDPTCKTTMEEPNVMVKFQNDQSFNHPVVGWFSTSILPLLSNSQKCQTGQQSLSFWRECHCQKCCVF